MQRTCGTIRTYIRALRLFNVKGDDSLLVHGSLLQWRTQDFSDEGLPTPKRGHQPIIWPNCFPNDCMREEGELCASGARYLRSLLLPNHSTPMTDSIASF